MTIINTLSGKNKKLFFLGKSQKDMFWQLPEKESSTRLFPATHRQG